MVLIVVGVGDWFRGTEHAVDVLLGHASVDGDGRLVRVVLIGKKGGRGCERGCCRCVMRVCYEVY